MLSWVHFGDLHASPDDGYGSLNHLRAMIGQVNRHLSDRVDFAFLPGDNANNGTPEQFKRILGMTRELRLDLDPWLESPRALGPMIDPNLHSCGTVPP